MYPHAPPEPAIQRHPLDILVNCMVGVIWINGKRKHWFLGSITEYDHDNPDEAMVDHLDRTEYHDATWKYPAEQDLCSVDLVQIIPIPNQTDIPLPLGSKHSITKTQAREP